VLAQRFAKYGLALHPEKTRLLKFGRSALPTRPGQRRPATFDFLGFTHVCARSRRGRFSVHVRTRRTRLQRSLKAVAQWCQQHRHAPLADQAAALNAKLRGHYQDYGRPTNARRLGQFYRQAGAIRCNARRHRWHLRQRRHCRINKLQILKGLHGFESHLVRQHELLCFQ
jgi:hypothetical protein